MLTATSLCVSVSGCKTNQSQKHSVRTYNQLTLLSMTKTKKNRSKKRTTKLPITKKEFKKDRETISKFHEIVKKHDSLNTHVTLKKSIEFDKYQAESSRGENLYGNFNCAKWVVSTLQELSLLNSVKKLNLLDVGALNHNYKKFQNTINLTAIDLNPQHPFVQKADFITFQKDERSLYDCIVLSLVLNFTGNAKKRGHMLLRASKLCEKNGLLFITLPKPCLFNSRYTTEDSFTSLLKSIGFDVQKTRSSEKLWSCYAKKVNECTKKLPIIKKIELLKGRNRNNFCILLR